MNAALPNLSWMNELSVRTAHCLRQAQLTDEAEVYRLLRQNPSPLLKVPDFGHKCLEELKHHFQERGAPLRYSQFQKQKHYHRPEEGEYGDCHRTCLANLMGVDRDSVPNFGEHYGDSEKFFEAERQWLLSQGLATVQVGYDGSLSLQQVLDTMGALNPGIYYLLGGTSASGVGHSVIGLGNRIVFDPSLNDSGIVGPMEDGRYWIQFLVPARVHLEPHDNPVRSN